ncbi:MAG: type II secretion system F family protein [Thermoproteota archaeon]
MSVKDQFTEFFTALRDLPTTVKEFSDDIYSQFRENYYDSGISMYFGDYVFRMKIGVVAALVATAVASTILHYIFLPFSPLRLILAVIGLSITGFSVSVLAFLYYPVYKKNNAKAKLESRLAYSLSYMTVLSATGMPIERIMARLSDIEEGTPIGRLAKQFTTNTRVFGYDVLSALKDIAERSPSKTFTTILYSLRNTIFTSGDLKSIFSYEVDRQIQKKMEGLSKMLSSLTYVGELYVVMMVVAPILFILMLTILSTIGGGFGGSPVLQLNLITFFGIPIIATVFIVILDMVLGEEEE